LSFWQRGLPAQHAVSLARQGGIVKLEEILDPEELDRQVAQGPL